MGYRAVYAQSGLRSKLSRDIASRRTRPVHHRPGSWSVARQCCSPGWVRGLGRPTPFFDDWTNAPRAVLLDSPVHIAGAAIKFALDDLAGDLTGYKTYFHFQAARGTGAVGESK